MRNSRTKGANYFCCRKTSVNGLDPFHGFLKKSAGRGAHTIPLLPAFFPLGKNHFACPAHCVSSLEQEELRAGGHRIGDDEGSA
jgi:hypothetical protein